MQRRSLLAFLLFFITPTVALADCGAGYWMNGTTCELCERTENPAYYCPGDGTRHQCPVDTPEMIEMYEQLTGGRYILAGGYWTPASASLITNEKQCVHSIRIETSAGRYYRDGYFDGEKYWAPGNSPLWYVAFAGHYLSGWLYLSTNHWYSGVKECTNAPANAHYTGPGTPDEPVAGGKKDYNDCPWACDDGYKRNGNECVVAICTVGQYLDGSCTTCETGYYCPGDDSRQTCPDPWTHVRTTFPDKYFNPTVYSTHIPSPYIGLAMAEECTVVSWMRNERGTLYEYARYNPETEMYDRTIPDDWGSNWASANPGYYLYNPTVCGKYAYYNNVSECRPGHYCPGKEQVECDTSNRATVHTETFGLNPCPARSTNEITGAASVMQCACTVVGESMRPIGDDGACTKTCTAGATEFHAGDLMFRLWGECASPALRVGLGGDVCCVNLESGTTTGAVHVQYSGTTYHTVN